MKCKACKNEVPDGSVFCNHCGEKLVKTKKQEISVPKPRQLKSGEWWVQLVVKGRSEYITAATEAECRAKARAIKLGLLEKARTKGGKTLHEACRDFIDLRSSVLSPSTISGYESILRTRFLKYQDKDYLQINWQQMINAEAALCSPKTLKNSWGFVCSVLREQGIEKPNVRLPKLVPEELPWLTPEQIPVFLDAIRDKPVELAALFALHGLRKSEFVALKPEHIRDGVIYIEGTRVRDKNNELVYKRATKTEASRRPVKIRSPRLRELLEASDTPQGEYYITMSTNNLHTAINRLCESAQLPCVGCHGLRRSFASLCYYLGLSERETMREGGWSDVQTMHKKYIKLAEAEKSTPDALDDFFNKAEK